MEKKTTVVKENHNRENQHFSETWFREGARLGLPTKLPHSIVDKSQDAREEVSKILRKRKIIAHAKFWILSIGTVTAFFYFFPKLLRAIF